MKKNSNSRLLEWFKQSDYDLTTAEAMFKTRRYIYAVFMCHLSIEKALKGLYWQSLNKQPPKIHDLINLLTQIGIEPPKELKEFMGHLTEMSIITRYPDILSKLQKVFTQTTTKKILNQTKETLKWVRRQLNKSF